MMPLLKPDQPAAGAVRADGDVPGRNRKGDRAEILADQAARGHVLAGVAGRAVRAALRSTVAVAITSPVANEPMMVEPGELTPASPPSATLTPALLTVTSAFDPVIKPEWPPKSKVPFAPTSPPSIAPETVPPSTSPLAVTLLIDALIGAGHRTDGLERDARVGGHVDIRQVQVAHDAGGADDAEQPDIVGGRVRSARWSGWRSSDPGRRTCR